MVSKGVPMKRSTLGFGNKAGVGVSLCIGFSLMVFGCGGGSSDSAKKDSLASISKTISGIVSDGYLKDSTVCLDVDGNGRCDKGEASTKTKSSGEFSLNVELPKEGRYPLLVFGGVDTATNLAFEGTFQEMVDINDSAPVYKTVTPLTTLRFALYRKKSLEGGSFSLEDATKTLADAFGLEIRQIEADPMRDKAVFAKSQQIMQTLELLSRAITLEQNSSMSRNELYRHVLKHIVISMQRQSKNSDLNVTDIVESLHESSFAGKSVLVGAKIERFVSDYIKEIEKKTLQIDKVEDLSKLQLGFATFSKKAIEQMRNDDSRLDSLLIEMKEKSVDGFIEGTKPTPMLVLNPIEDEIEDELAEAILKAQEAITLTKITENRFLMGKGDNWQLDYYNMTKSYEQAAASLQELVDVHTKMEKYYTKRASKLRKSAAKSYAECDYEKDPYCISGVQHRKIDFYLDHFGETTPGGKKIDIKTIAMRTQLSMEFIARLLREKYYNVAIKESRYASQMQYYEDVAKTISDTSDIITAIGGLGTGAQLAVGAIKYGMKRKAMMTLFKSQLTKPATMTQEVYDGLRSYYFSVWSKESSKLVLKAREGVLQGTWDLASNFIELYDKAINLGYASKSERISNAKNVVDWSKTVMNIANISKTVTGEKGLGMLIVLAPKGNPGKKDILFVSKTLSSELVRNNHNELLDMLKQGIGIVYDENGNIKISIADITKEEMKKIADKRKEEQADILMQEGEYEYLDENNDSVLKKVSNDIDVKYVEKAYHKNTLNLADEEFRELPSCDEESQKLVGDECVDKTCQADNYNCPSCEDGKVLSYDSDGNGICEWKDTDGDGVYDKYDHCPNEAGLFVESTKWGCPVDKIYTDCNVTTGVENGLNVQTCRFTYKDTGESQIVWQKKYNASSGTLVYEAAFAVGWNQKNSNASLTAVPRYKKYYFDDGRLQQAQLRTQPEYIHWDDDPKGGTIATYMKDWIYYQPDSYYGGHREVSHKKYAKIKTKNYGEVNCLVSWRVCGASDYYNGEYHAFTCHDKTQEEINDARMFYCKE